MWILIFLVLCKQKTPPYVRPSDSLAIEITPSTFQTYIKEGNLNFVCYYAHWCHYSKKMLPKLDKLSHKIKDLPIKIVTYDCEAKGQHKICDNLKIDGYPTLYSYNGEKQVKEYEKGENVDYLYEFVTQFLDSVNKKAVEDTKGYDFVQKYFTSSSSVPNINGRVVELTDDNFDGTTKGEPWFIDFYATWCGHCKQLEPTWIKLGEQLKGKVNIGKVEASQNSKVANRFSVQGYPTLLFINGENVIKYKGDRTLTSLKQFAKGSLAKSEIREFTEKDLRVIENFQSVGFLIYSNTIDNTLKTYAESMKELSPFAPFYTMSLKSAKYFLPVFNSNLGPATANNLKSTDSYIMYYYPNALVANKLSFYFPIDSSFIELKNWYIKNRFPFVTDMDSENSEPLLTEPQITVLGIGQSRMAFEEIATTFKNIIPPHKFEADLSRAVQFAMVNKEPYGQWFEKQFGILTGIVILDTKADTYYKTDPNGSPITINSVLPSLLALIKNPIIVEKLSHQVSQYDSWGEKTWQGHSFGASASFGVFFNSFSQYFNTLETIQVKYS